MARLDKLLNRVFDEFPAVPKTLALRALSDSVREFCDRSHAWQIWLPDIGVGPGEAVYELILDVGTRATALKEVRLNGARVAPVATEWRNLAATDSRLSWGNGYFQTQSDAIELVHAPAEAGILKIRAALSLDLGSEIADIPDALISEYGEVLASGAKMRLVRQAGQPWFNPDLVIGYAGPFYLASDRAKARANTALGEAQIQVAMRRW